MARQGIVFADINADWYKIAIGTLLLVAVVLNNWIRRRFAGLPRRADRWNGTQRPVAEATPTVAGRRTSRPCSRRATSRSTSARSSRIEGVSLTVRAGQVTCLLGDNGAGKSTLIKTLSGVYRPDKGTLAVDGQPVEFSSPRDALDAGIATVYQDLSVMPLMTITRNFFLGNEPTVGVGPFKRFDLPKAAGIAREEMKRIGIDVRDTDQAVGTLSGGERQTLAIARAEYFGARVLILDEPTSALGRQAVGDRAAPHHRGAQPRPGRDLHHPQRVARAADRRHVHDPVARPDRRSVQRGEVDADQLHSQMGGGDELARADARARGAGDAASASRPCRSARRAH